MQEMPEMWVWPLCQEDLQEMEEATNALQYSCLERPMDREAWQATVYGVTKSWTQLSTHTRTHTHTCFPRNHVQSSTVCLYVLNILKNWIWFEDVTDCWVWPSAGLPRELMLSKQICLILDMQWPWSHEVFLTCSDENLNWIGLKPRKIQHTDLGLGKSREWSSGASLVAQTVKNLPAMQETWVRSLIWEDPLEKGMTAHSSILTWRITWTEEPGGL